jgi:hypothetical protein
MRGYGLPFSGVCALYYRHLQNQPEKTVHLANKREWQEALRGEQARSKLIIFDLSLAG